MLTAPPDPEMIGLARQLIARQAGKYDPADVQDRYEERLRALIDAKLEGKGSNLWTTANPMAALKRSLGQTAYNPPGKAARSPDGRKAAAKPSRAACADAARDRHHLGSWLRAVKP